MNQTSDTPSSVFKMRRHDIDWLRVIMFGLLIPYHVAVGFTGWPIYAYNNNDSGGLLLQLFLQFVHQWRIPVLFLISGMGTCFAMKRRTGKQFILERMKRLLIPLIFGMNFIIIFQSYYAALHRGKVDSIFDFAISWWSHLGEMQHLWFLGNLFVYSLLCVPLLIYIRNNSDGVILKTVKNIIGLPKGIGLLFFVPIPLIIVELLAKPWAFGFIGRGYEFPLYLLFFIIGYLCIMTKDLYWKALDEVRYISLVLGIVCTVLLFVLMNLADKISYGYGTLILNGGWFLYGDKIWGPLTFPACILHALNAWYWCIAVFSWGAKYLNKPGKYLVYFNQAVYPFYIVHMPFCLIGLYYLKDVELYWPLKFLIITVITVAGSWITFEIVKHNRATQMLFGIKPLPKLKEV